jgi:hypothetical protein
VTGPVTRRISAWRGEATKRPEALEIVEGVVEGMDLELAAIARAGIDRADRKAAAEPAARRAGDALGELGERCVVLGGRRFGERAPPQALEQ